MEVFRQICYTTSSSSSASSASSSSSSLRQGGGANPASALLQQATGPGEVEHMFDKVVTPSDVGKLNRLVIPKQYAERYFPLDPSSADKGVVLCFEDRTGKQWQFRYSYWNSSQSYVITKGWSRFVKDKQLDPGDTVSFSRTHHAAADNGCRLLIDCHRRHPLLRRRNHPPAIPVQQFAAAAARSAARWAGFFPAVAAANGAAPPSLYSGRLYTFYGQSTAPPPPSPQGRVQDGGGGLPSVQEPEPEQVPVLQTNMAEPKRVRLFGVDLEFSEQITPAGSGASDTISTGDQIPFNEEDGN